MKLTLLFAALSMVAQLSLAQVVISDDGTQTADANAVLHLKSDSKGLLLPTISSVVNDWPESSNGMLATHVVNGKTLLYYFNGRELAPGFKVWDVVLTDQSYISALRDVKRNDDGTSYYIGRETAITAAAAQFNTVFGKDAGNFNQSSDTPAKGNSVLGYQAADFANDPTFCTFIGYQADAGPNSTDATYSTAIGAGSRITGDNQIVLGRSNEHVVIPGLYGGATTADSTTNKAVYVTDNGTLIVAGSRAPGNGDMQRKIEQLEQENAILKSEVAELRRMIEGILEVE